MTTSMTTSILSILSAIVPARAASMLEALGAQGVTGPAALAVVALGAAERHLARVRFALALALAYAYTWDEEEEEAAARGARLALDLTYAVVGSNGKIEKINKTTMLDAWCVLTLDVGGVGGQQDAEGVGTARHPGLEAAGNGRKRANDGPAWTGAIEGAAHVLEAALARMGMHRLRLAPDPAEGPTSDMIGVQWSPDPQDPEAGPACWQGVPCAHPRWARAEALRQMKDLVGGAAPEGLIARWARVFNRAHDYLTASGAVGAIRDRGGPGDRALLWTEGVERALQLMDGRDAVLWSALAAEAGAAGAELVPVPVHHEDHGVPPMLVAWAWHQAPAEGFFARTWEVPGAALECLLHGPATGGAPVVEAEVVRHQRTPDRPPSRCVARDPLVSDQLTVIGVKNPDGTGRVFTAYGGPLAPREPGDPTLPAEGPEREEAEAFWAVHALSIPEG